MTLSQRLRAWRTWRTLKVTRTGRTYLVVTIGIGLGALNTGNNLLYLVLGFLLSLIVASGVLSERVLQGVAVRRLLPDGAYAQEPFAVRYEVSVSKGHAFALTLSEGDRLDGSAFVPVVTSQAPVTARATMTAGRRGPLRLGEIFVTTTWPFGIFAKTSRVQSDEVLLVYPRRGFACVEPPQLDGAPAGDGGNPRRRDGTGDLLGLKELADGEDARRVHWVKSAAVGKLLKVEREREERRQFMLEVAASLSGEGLEQRCEEVAALTHRLLGQGHEVGLSSQQRQLRPASGVGQERRVLSALAWVGFDPDQNEGSP